MNVTYSLIQFHLFLWELDLNPGILVLFLDFTKSDSQVKFSRISIVYSSHFRKKSNPQILGDFPHSVLSFRDLILYMITPAKRFP